MVDNALTKRSRIGGISGYNGNNGFVGNLGDRI